MPMKSGQSGDERCRFGDNPARKPDDFGQTHTKIWRGLDVQPARQTANTPPYLGVVLTKTCRNTTQFRPDRDLQRPRIGDNSAENPNYPRRCRSLQSPLPCQKYGAVRDKSNLAEPESHPNQSPSLSHHPALIAPNQQQSHRKIGRLPG